MTKSAAAGGTVTVIETNEDLEECDCTKKHPLEWLQKHLQNIQQGGCGRVNKKVKRYKKLLKSRLAQDSKSEIKAC